MSKIKDKTSDAYFETAIKYNAHIKDQSQHVYLNSMNAIKKLTHDTTIYNVLMNPDKNGKILNDSNLNENTHKTYLASILAYLKHTDLKATHHHIFEKWYKWFIPVKEKIRQRELNREPTERMRNAHVEWEQIVKFIKNMPSGNSKHLLMCMTCMLPPRRQLDWFQVKIYIDPLFKPKLDHNFIHLTWNNAYHIHLTDYKTSSTYGIWRRRLPPNLHTVIMSSMVSNPREYLFLDATNNPFKTVKTFTTWSNRTIKRVLNNDDASMNTLRHSFAHYIQKINPNMTGNERAAIAMDMGHDAIQNMAYDFVSQSNNFKTGTTFTDLPRS